MGWKIAGSCGGMRFRAPRGRSAGVSGFDSSRNRAGDMV